jgi:putative transposase
MKKTRFSESKIIGILKENESGISASELCRKYGMSEAAFYKWRSKYGGMDVSMMKRVRELEVENARLKKMYADTCMDNEILREVLGKK